MVARWRFRYWKGERNLILLLSESLYLAFGVPLRASLKNWEGAGASQLVGMNGPSGQRSASGAREPGSLGSQSTDHVNRGAYVLSRGSREAEIALTGHEQPSTTKKKYTKAWRLHMITALVTFALDALAYLLSSKEEKDNSYFTVQHLIYQQSAVLFQFWYMLCILGLADLSALLHVLFKVIVSGGSAWVEQHIMGRPSIPPGLKCWSCFTQLFSHIRELMFIQHTELDSRLGDLVNFYFVTKGSGVCYFNLALLFYWDCNRVATLYRLCAFLLMLITILFPVLEKCGENVEVLYLFVSKRWVFMFTVPRDLQNLLSQYYPSQAAKFCRYLIGETISGDKYSRFF